MPAEPVRGATGHTGTNRGRLAMVVDCRGVHLTPAELDALIEPLIRDAQVHRIGSLSEHLVPFIIIAARVAECLQREANETTMTVQEYARATGMSERTIRHQCQHGLIDARKQDGRWHFTRNRVGNPTNPHTNAA